MKKAEFVSRALANLIAIGNLPIDGNYREDYNRRINLRRITKNENDIYPDISIATLFSPDVEDNDTDITPIVATFIKRHGTWESHILAERQKQYIGI